MELAFKLSRLIPKPGFWSRPRPWCSTSGSRFRRAWVIEPFISKTIRVGTIGWLYFGTLVPLEHRSQWSRRLRSIHDADVELKHTLEMRTLGTQYRVPILVQVPPVSLWSSMSILKQICNPCSRFFFGFCFFFLFLRFSSWLQLWSPCLKEHFGSGSAGGSGDSSDIRDSRSRISGIPL